MNWGRGGGVKGALKDELGEGGGVKGALKDELGEGGVHGGRREWVITQGPGDTP